MRYFIKLAYRGTNYNGWQIQKNAPSVQQTLQDGLSTLLREKIDVVGAGRTDTGVHASFYIAHFDVNKSLERLEDFTYHLNSILPDDIAVKDVFLVNDDAHARFDAIEREYRYYILDHKEPFRRETSWQYYIQLDIDKMNMAASMLLNTEDFTTFSKLHSNNKTNICHVGFAQWKKNNGELVFTIRADRFLRNMVRSLVGTLVDVGRNKISVEEFKKILASKDRSLSSGSAPAQGLFLSDVKYGETIKNSI